MAVFQHATGMQHVGRERVQMAAMVRQQGIAFFQTSSVQY
jgi:hypothetical protein